MMFLVGPDGSEREIAPEAHSAVKALGRDPAHQRAVEFIIETLCGRHRASFVVGMTNTAETTAWLEGRRYVGEMLARMIERPVDVPPKPDAPLRTHESSVQRQKRTRAKPARG